MTGLQRPWLIDGRTGFVTTYGQLLDKLNRVPVTTRPRHQPGSVSGALTEIAKAIAFGTELTLFDTDFGEWEIKALGYRRAELNQSAPVSDAVVIDLPRLSAAAAGASPARIGLFTSGSTGLPKLVWQKISNLARAVKVSPRHGEAVWALAYNPTHVAAIQVYLQALANGCTVVDIYGLSRKQVLAALERHRVTHLSATPSFYRLLLPAERPLQAIRSVTLGGESSDAALLGRLRPFFPSARFHNVYASTEAGTLLVADGDAFSIAGGLEKLVILREGRIHIHRSLLGEFAAESARAAIQGDWYDTGDVVELVSSEPLQFRVVARERDWVNVGGSKVNPREVEAVMEEYPGIRKAHVYGRPNSVIGHILCAEVECHGDRPTEQALREFADTRLQGFKIPRSIRFVDQIAQTRTGKLSRT